MPRFICLKSCEYKGLKFEADGEYALTDRNVEKMGKDLWRPIKGEVKVKVEDKPKKEKVVEKKKTKKSKKKSKK